MPRHRTSLLPSIVAFVVAVTAFLPSSPAEAVQSSSVEFELYPAESNMGRTNLISDETATARPTVLRQGTHVFQVFINKNTGRELFRVDVGTTEATYWVYGLVREADFNGDGIPDFSWHGGDDTSDVNLAVLSSPNGYRKVDLDATLNREWRREFPSDPPEDRLAEDPIYSDMQLVRRAGKLTLIGIIHYSAMSGDGIKQHERRLSAKEQDFVYVK